MVEEEVSCLGDAMGTDAVRHAPREGNRRGAADPQSASSFDHENFTGGSPAGPVQQLAQRASQERFLVRVRE
jgi:hypothetical protein